MADDNITKVTSIIEHLSAEPFLIQALIGPRQVGKTTAAAQIADAWEGPVIFASADEPLPPTPEWVTHHWNIARDRQESEKKRTLLVLDEIQKVQGWSEIVKLHWDKDKRSKNQIAVLILGSAALLVQKGLSESLTGRFFLHRFSHWGYRECREVFDLTLRQWLYFGGYPGALPMIKNEKVWQQYVRDSLIETVIAKDVLQMHTVNKPALLRHLFMLSTAFPAEILSYNKMLGQLQDAGNTTTLAHYIDLLSSAFLLSGIENFKISKKPRRSSSPKLILWNNALVSGVTSRTFETAVADHTYWGRLVENAVGGALLEQCRLFGYELYYWRNNEGKEVDYILKTPKDVFAIEVKSSKPKKLSGLSTFIELLPTAKPIIIGGNGIELESFFLEPEAFL